MENVQLPTDIAFLAIAEAHQIYHWLPAALALSRRHGVKVSVLSPSRAILGLIASYDPAARLSLIKLRNPSIRADSLFHMPKRTQTLLLNYDIIRRFPILATSEVTSSKLRRMPGFRSRMICIKHGAGDGERGYDRRHAAYDLTIVGGQKDRRRLIERGLVTSENCRIGGYAKFELRAQPRHLFDNDLPTVLYNPHFDREVSSWMKAGPAILQALEGLTGWNVIIAPHVKMAKNNISIQTCSPHIRVDMGSKSSIDMSYTVSADIYMGDASSQVYEFLLTPRPCVFLNPARHDWKTDPAVAHWHFGQVVENMNDIQAALDRAAALQHSFVDAQNVAIVDSLEQSLTPASERQADIILDFART